MDDQVAFPVIRSLRDSDREAWRALYFQYLAFEKVTPRQEDIDLLWGRLTGDMPAIQGLIVEEQGQAVAFAHFHFQLSTWTSTWHCYLEDLFVEASSRHQGIGTALIRSVRAEAAAKQCTEFFWLTRGVNVRAKSLYDKIAHATDYIRYELPMDG